MPPHRPPLLTTILFGTLLLVGCQSRPSVRGLDARVLDRNERAIQVGVDLELSNPTAEPLTMAEFDYSFSTAGRTVYRGRRAAQITIDRQGSRLVTVPAVVRYDQVDWADGPPASFDYTISGTLRYILPGALNRTLVELGLRRPDVNFQARGTVDAGSYVSLATRRTSRDR